MATKAERDLILDMLAAGRIDAIQARRLFDAVDRFSDDEQPINPLPVEYTESIRKTIQQRFRQVERILEPLIWEF